MHFRVDFASALLQNSAVMEAISVRGRCRCEHVKFVLREEPIAFYLCHCTDCQAESGSAFGQSMLVRKEAIGDVTGPLDERISEQSDGRRAHVTFCADCMTMIWGWSEDIPQLRGLNAGGLDASGGLEPYGNMWTRSARRWVKFAEGPCFEQQPEDVLAMIHAWAGRPK
jgi:hypothetical protein